jgi:DNA invertase Pin-like site-specific DNA recombinase
MNLQDKTPTRAIGYIRVSTDKQNDGDHALAQQAERVRQACIKHGFSQDKIYEDTGTAVGAHSLSHRPGLVEAFGRAELEDLILVVPDATRLFRDFSLAKEFLGKTKVKIFSVRDGRILGTKALLKKIAEGAKVAESIRDGSRVGLAKKKAAGKVTGTITAKSNSTEASARVRGQKAESVLERIVAVLQEDPAYRTLTHKAFADLLNRRRIYSGWERQWTEDSVRSKHREAKKLLAEREQMEAEIDAEEALADVPGVFEQNHLNAAKPPVQETSDADDAETAMRKNPLFGMF